MSEEQSPPPNRRDLLVAAGDGTGGAAGREVDEDKPLKLAATLKTPPWPVPKARDGSVRDY